MGNYSSRKTAGNSIDSNSIDLIRINNNFALFSIEFQMNAIISSISFYIMKTGRMLLANINVFSNSKYSKLIGLFSYDDPEHVH